MFGVSLLGLNPIMSLLCSFVVVIGSLWGLVWGGIKMWHKQASKSLEGKIAPYFDKVDKRLDAQDEVLGDVQHEVTTNSGQSLKDEVKRVSGQVSEIMGVLTTSPPTALNPFPRLGVIDLQIAQGRVLQKLADDIVPDNGTTGHDLLQQISNEQSRVAEEKAEAT